MYEQLQQAINNELEYLLEGVSVIYYLEGSPTSALAPQTFKEIRRTFYEQQTLYVSVNNTPDYLTVETNAKARAIHDVIHCRYNYDFGLSGELCTWEETVKLLGLTSSSLVGRYLYSEIVVQAYKYLKEGEFPEQQVLLKTYDHMHTTILYASTLPQYNV